MSATHCLFHHPASPVVAAVIIELLRRFVIPPKPQHVYLRMEPDSTILQPDSLPEAALCPNAPEEAQPSDQSSGAASATKYAGFEVRFYAFAIDLVILLLGTMALYSVVLSVGLVAASVDENLVELIGGSLVYLMTLLYFSILWGFRGQTMGYRAQGLRLLRRDHANVGPMRSLVRTVAFGIALYSIIGIALLLFNGKKRTLADYITNTIVVREE